MEAKAILKMERIAPRKARLVIDLIRGKDVADAKAILNNQTQKAAFIINKVLDSAVANAVNNLKLDEKKLYVKECYVNEGQVMKRLIFDSRGHVGRKDKKTSHITIVVSDERK